MADSDLQAIPEGLFGQIRALIGEARQQALRAVDVVQVQTCWQIGRHIVEFEQNGAEPVSYTHLRAHKTVLDIVCRLLLEKKKTHIHNKVHVR